MILNDEQKAMLNSKRDIILFGFLTKALSDRKEVNTSNEGRNPSQLSADYYYLRLR